MRKNKMMRLASALLVAVLLTTCAISGTFAKYTTSVTSQDAARVATWGFTSTSMDLTNLFSKTYTNVASGNAEDVIAPGTDNMTGASFQFKYDGEQAKPEVAYTFTIEVTETCDKLIKANKNIIWYLDGAACSDWDDLIAKIKLLSGEADGSKDYAAGELPAGFTASDDVHTIAWEWLISGTETYDHDNDPLTPDLTQDQYDTYMGNQADLDDVSIIITITATQLD